MVKSISRLDGPSADGLEPNLLLGNYGNSSRQADLPELIERAENAAHIKPFITPTKIGGRRVIQSTQSIWRVSATDVATRDELLNSAVEGLIPHALALNHGIKVIRIHPGNYIVETTADVPCGYTICEPR